MAPLKTDLNQLPSENIANFVFNSLQNKASHSCDCDDDYDDSDDDNEIDADYPDNVYFPSSVQPYKNHPEQNLQENTINISHNVLASFLGVSESECALLYYVDTFLIS